VTLKLSGIKLWKYFKNKNIKDVSYSTHSIKISTLADSSERRQFICGLI
jgi:hypothetical protein